MKLEGGTMHRRRHFEVWVLAMALSTLTAAGSNAQTVWSGPTLSFSKAAFSDPTLPANQDAVLPGVVSITRGDTRGIFNPVTEVSFASGVSPAGRSWDS
jgi:hypothetical protein